MNNKKSISDASEVMELIDEPMIEAYFEVYGEAGDEMIAVENIFTNRSNTISKGILAQRTTTITFEVHISPILQREPTTEKKYNDDLSQIQKTMFRINQLSDEMKDQSYRKFTRELKKILKQDRNQKHHEDENRILRKMNQDFKYRFTRQFIKNQWGWFSVLRFKHQTFTLTFNGKDLNDVKYVKKKIKNRILLLSNSNIETI